MMGRVRLRPPVLRRLAVRLAIRVQCNFALRPFERRRPYCGSPAHSMLRVRAPRGIAVG